MEGECIYISEFCQYRVAWRNRQTGTEGRSFWIGDAVTAQAWFADTEGDLPEADVWIQRRYRKTILDRAA